MSQIRLLHSGASIHRTSKNVFACRCVMNSVGALITCLQLYFQFLDISLYLMPGPNTTCVLLTNARNYNNTR